jgi:hypothetical protein
MKGKPQLNDLEQVESKLKSAAREKKLAGPPQQTATHPTFVQQRGSTLEYLIGQQRVQSIPHRAPKSSAN